MEHTVHAHAILAEAAQVEVAARVGPGLRRRLRGRPALAAAVAAAWGREDLEVAPRDEARVAQAHVHRALRRVSPDGHRALLHQVLKLTALEALHCPAARRGPAAPGAAAARGRPTRARQCRGRRHGPARARAAFQRRHEAEGRARPPAGERRAPIDFLS